MELRNCADGPLIVQSDLCVLADASHRLYDECRGSLSSFAELLKSPEYMHTYRITPISLWNAAALGFDANAVLRVLKKYSRYEVPDIVIYQVTYYISRYGKLTLRPYKDERYLELVSNDPYIIIEIAGNDGISKYIAQRKDEFSVLIKPNFRGELKRALINIHYPVKDIAGYEAGSPFSIPLRKTCRKGNDFILRDYQNEAVQSFYRSGAAEGGSGVVSLACGAGKTCVGIGAMSLVGAKTLIITSNTVAVRQWISELFDKTDISPEDIGEYSGEKKQIRPITVTTYQILMWHRGNDDHYPHFCVLTDSEWGLVIYDEVHLLPAPIFRVTAQIQAKRRLGLTATLIREDALEGDVFSLIGPKVYELSWKSLEKKGFIAKANCYEIRVKMNEAQRYDYAVAKKSLKHRFCAVNHEKINVIKKIIEAHPDEPALIIGQYIDQIKYVAETFNAPLITGATKPAEREALYKKFKLGEIAILVVSKVANFAIDLPDASCAIQISGAFGSRQEEAQRLGRVLRPKRDGREAHFYSIVTSDSVELDFSMHRQLFLTEQGYKYYILNGDEYIGRKLIEFNGDAATLNRVICI